jgi:hypothetical protein
MEPLDIVLRSKVARLPGETTPLRTLHNAFCTLLLPGELPNWNRKAFADALRRKGVPVGRNYNGLEVVGNLRLIRRKRFVDVGGYLRPIAA